jgi:hypothetical protein
MAGPRRMLVGRVFRRAAEKGTRAACVPRSVCGGFWTEVGAGRTRGFGQDARNDRLEAGATQGNKRSRRRLDATTPGVNFLWRRIFPFHWTNARGWCELTRH